jgi:lipid II:glycine glycyltransferase (peptidoglycan interpeptide bridge formation enzyme)
MTRVRLVILFLDFLVVYYITPVPEHAILKSIIAMPNTSEPKDNQAPPGWDVVQRKLGASFLQSTGWAHFQEAIGNRPHYLSGDGWSCLLLERRASFGRYLFAPYGPTISTPAATDTALAGLKAFGKKQGVDWLRLEPISAQDESLIDSLKKAGGRPAPHEAEPHLTRILDITPEPEVLLSSLSQTTRNIIRRNERQKTLAFRTSLNPDDIRIFSDMLGAVASRKNVSFSDAGYFKRQAEILMPAGMLHLELAYHEKRPAGAAIIHDFGTMASYTYAASPPEARELNVSALLLWQAIINAKSRGMKSMDLYGIAPESAPASHPWAGFSSFKKKFGGNVVERAGTWDIPLTTRYKLYRAGLRARRLTRR